MRCGPRFGSIPARRNLPFDAAAAFTTIALGANSALCPATSHQAGSRELSERLKI
jgi:hypothetical protein